MLETQASMVAELERIEIYPLRSARFELLPSPSVPRIVGLNEV